MDTSLLMTKIGVPSTRPHTVCRARLIDRLREGLSYPLVLVSAPAGFGKTTLLVEWARFDRPAVPTAWLSLDQGDSDPARFWAYFVAALDSVDPGVAERARPLLDSPRPLSAEPLLSILINEFSSLADDVVVVLDDYQFIRSPDVHAGLTFWLEHVPAHMHLVIATRADPPLPLARWRGQGKMLEIGVDALRFTVDEAADYLQALRGSRLGSEEVKALNLRTEGWAVGLKMAALSIGSRDDISQFVNGFTGSQRYVMDYLIEEVLAQQSSEQVDFLLRTSVLGRFTASLCAFITGRSDSAKLLSDLERAHLFLVPLDGSCEWFRYEHLFADILRHQLQAVSGAGAVAELHRLASAWCEAEGLLNDAVDYALAAGDWPGAARLILEVSERQSQTGEVVTLLGWLAALPDDMRNDDARLGLLYAWVLMSTGRLDDAEAALSAVSMVAGEHGAVPARITAYRALISVWRGEAAKAAVLSQQALAVLPPEDAALRGSLSLHLGMMQWYSGRLGEAARLFEEAYEVGRRLGNRWIAATALGFLSSVSLWRGNLREAMQVCERAIEMVDGLPAAAQPHQFLGEALYELNDLDAATLHLTKAIELNKVMGTREVDEAASYHLMRISLALGDNAGAHRAIEGIDQRATKDHSPVIRARHAAYHLDLALAEGDLDQASRWGALVESFGDLTPFYLRHLPVRLLIAQGKNQHVAGQLEKFYASAQAEWLSPEWQGWLVRARLYQALSAPEREVALALVTEALVAGEAAGWMRLWVDEGPVLAPLLRRAASAGVAQEYVSKLLTIIEAEERASRDSKGRSSKLVYGLLTGREAEVVSMLAAGLSNRQISERLFISLGTTKSHIHNISEKLNVTGRTRIIARARDLHLI